FGDQRVTFLILDTDEVTNLARVEVERLPAGLRMGTDYRMEHRLPVLVLDIEQLRLAAPAAIGESADNAVEPLFQSSRQCVKGAVGSGEERVAAAAGYRQRVELRRLKWSLVVGPVGVPALGATPVDLLPQLALGIKFVDPEHRDLGVVGMARRFRRVRCHRSKT